MLRFSSLLFPISRNLGICILMPLLFTSLSAQSPAYIYAYLGGGLISGNIGQVFNGYSQQIGLGYQFSSQTRLAFAVNIGMHKMNGLDAIALRRYQATLLDGTIDVTSVDHLDRITWLESDLSARFLLGQQRKWGVGLGGRIATKVAERGQYYLERRRLNLRQQLSEDYLIFPSRLDVNGGGTSLSSESEDEVLNKLNYAAHLGTFCQLTKGVQLELTSHAYFNNLFTNGAFLGLTSRPLTLEFKTIVRL